MTRIALNSLILIFFLTLSGTAYSWDLVLGMNRIYPKLGMNEQTYEGSSGGDLTFKPTISDSTIGGSFYAAIKLESTFWELERGKIYYETTIPASNSAVSEEVDIKAEINEERLSFNLFQERELAGIFLGIGVSREEEILKGSGREWKYTTITPFVRFGLELIFGMWRVRGDQIHMKIGEHNARINSLGVAVQF